MKSNKGLHHNNNLFDIFLETVIKHKCNNFNAFKGLGMFRCHPLRSQGHPLQIYLLLNHKLQRYEIYCKDMKFITNLVTTGRTISLPSVYFLMVFRTIMWLYRYLVMDFSFSTTSFIQ